MTGERTGLAGRTIRGQSAQAEIGRDDLAAQQEVVDAFLEAQREGDFHRLLALLDPDVVLRVDAGPDRPAREVRGAMAVARQALGYVAVPELDVRPALINGAVGSVSFLEGQPVSIAAVTIRGSKIIELDFLRDPARLGELDLAILRD